MKKVCFVFFSLLLSFVVVSCSNTCKKDIELMGAGDRIHDSYTFANTGVKIKEDEENVYTVYGSVEQLSDEKVKTEFNIASDISHVVAIKLCANGRVVDKEKVSIKVDGTRAYDAEHLNGSDYTFIILEASKGKIVSIVVSWDGETQESYVVKFDENITLK